MSHGGSINPEVKDFGQLAVTSLERSIRLSFSRVSGKRAPGTQQRA